MTSRRQPIRPTHPCRPPANVVADGLPVVRNRTAVSEQGRLTVKLRRTEMGLHVERCKLATQQLQVLRFSLLDKDAVERWLAHEPIRFEAPRLHLEIRRDADEIWDGTR